jgi:Tol biopolymer transport system component
MPATATRRPWIAFLAALALAACNATTSPPVASPTGSAASAPPSTAPAPSSVISVSPSAGASVAPTVDGQIVFEDAGRDFQFTQVWIENADGTNVRKRVSDSYTDGAAALSPDGRMVAFDRDPMVSLDEILADPTRMGSIMLVNVDGSGLHDIPIAGFGGPDVCGGGIEGDAFSPDGRRIVFSALCFRTGISSSLWTANIDGTNVREITRQKGSPEDRWRPEPAVKVKTA